MKTIYSYLFINLIFLFTIIKYTTSQSDPRDGDDVLFQHETYQIDNNQRFGRIRVSNYRQNDYEYDYLVNTNLICTTVKYDPYSIFSDVSTFLFDVYSNYTTTNDHHVPIFVTPNHIGKQSNFDQLIPMSAFHTLHNNDGAQICVRDFAHENYNFGETFILGYQKELDLTNASFDWLHITNNEFSSKTYVIGFEVYGCKNVEIDTVDVENSLFFVSLEHTFFFHFHYAGYVMHYDSVWIESTSSSSVTVCWLDEHGWNRSHGQVNVLLTVLPSADSAPIDTFPVPNKDYLTGRLEMTWSWESDVNAICTDVAFEQEFDYTPLIFLSLEKNGSNEETIDLKDVDATALWVESANPTGMQICLSEQSSSDKLVEAGTKFIVNYLILLDIASDDSSKQYQNGEGYISIEGKDVFSSTKIFSDQDALEKAMVEMVKSYFPLISSNNLLISSGIVSKEKPKEAPTETSSEAPTETSSEAPTETSSEAPTETSSEAPSETSSETPTETPTETSTETPTETLQFRKLVEESPELEVTRLDIFFKIINTLETKSILEELAETFNSGIIDYPPKCDKKSDKPYTRNPCYYTFNEKELSFLSPFLASDSKSAEVTFKFGGPCVHGSLEVSECTSIPCGEGGEQVVTRPVIKEAYGSAKCFESSYKSPCNVGQRFTTNTTKEFKFAEDSEFFIPYTYVNDFSEDLDDNKNVQVNDPSDDPEQVPVVEESGGMSSGIVALICIIVFVVLMIAEFFLLKSYFKKGNNYESSYAKNQIAA